MLRFVVFFSWFVIRLPYVIYVEEKICESWPIVLNLRGIFSCQFCFAFFSCWELNENLFNGSVMETVMLKRQSWLPEVSEKLILMIVLNVNVSSVRDNGLCFGKPKYAHCFLFNSRHFEVWHHISSQTSMRRVQCCQIKLLELQFHIP
jgi:hypothetical protein